MFKNPFRSLATLKHMTLSPLQMAWQMGQVQGLYPEMKPVIAAYQRYYHDILDTVGLAYDEKEKRQLNHDMTLTYGETRWTSFIKILQEVKLKKNDVFMDLGCGAGFLCFLVAVAYGNRAIGIDLIEGFIHNAQTMAQNLNLTNPEFEVGDFFQRDLREGSLFYITCTCFPPDYMQRLSQHLLQTHPGTRIITITRQLQGPGFQLLKRFDAKFSWDKDSVFLWERLADPEVYSS